MSLSASSDIHSCYHGDVSGGAFRTHTCIEGVLGTSSVSSCNVPESAFAFGEC